MSLVPCTGLGVALASRLCCLFTAGGPCCSVIPEEGNGGFNLLQGIILKPLEGSRHLTLQSALVFV